MSKKKFQEFKEAQAEKKKKQDEVAIHRFLKEKQREQRQQRIASAKNGLATAKRMISKIVPDKTPSKPPPRSIYW
jgi:multidrug resistance efflux pump